MNKEISGARYRASVVLIIVVALCGVMPCGARANNQARVVSKPRLIHIGWDSPTPKYVAARWKEMSRVAAFDGVAIKLESDTGVPVMQKMFTRHDLSKFPFEQATKQVKTATDNWRRERTLTDNFVWLMLSPEDWTAEGRGFSWADDALWNRFTGNAAVMARFAKRAGLKGLFLDPELYNETKYLSCDFMWRRDGFKENPGCSPETNPRVPEKYLPLLQRRGREFMQAMLKEYPDITIMTTMGHSAVRYNGTPYNLYAGFLDGVMQAMRDTKGANAVLHDGMEMYGHRKMKDSPNCQTVHGFECLYNDATTFGNYFSNEKILYDRYVKASPPVWIDMSRQWSDKPKDFTGNYYQPDELQTAIESAFKVSTGYVWLYSEIACFFPYNESCKTIGKPYLEAIARAKAKSR